MSVIDRLRRLVRKREESAELRPRLEAYFRARDMPPTLLLKNVGNDVLIRGSMVCCTLGAEKEAKPKKIFEAELGKLYAYADREFTLLNIGKEDRKLIVEMSYSGVRGSYNDRQEFGIKHYAFEE